MPLSQDIACDLKVNGNRETSEWSQNKEYVYKCIPVLQRHMLFVCGDRWVRAVHYALHYYVNKVLIDF